MLIEQIYPNSALYAHSIIADSRGSLIALEGERDVPFGIARAYFIFATEEGAQRGFHAHRSLEQWAVAVHGSCRFKLDDGTTRRELELTSPEQGIYIGPGIWHEMTDFSAGAVLLVLASAHYDEADYIRSYEEFLQVFGSKDA